MARLFLRLAIALILCVSLQRIAAETTAQPTAAENVYEYDINKELEKLKGWKSYLLGEVDKYKAELEKAQTALKAEQQRATELASTAEQWRKAATDADARAATAESKATAAAPQVAELTAQIEALKKDAAAAAARAADAEAKAAAADAAAKAAQAKAADVEARAAAQAGSSSQMLAQLEAARRDAAAAAAAQAAAESRASASAAAADAANGEAARLRGMLSAAVADREALESRVADFASATAKAGGLRGHAMAIYDILLQEAARHRDTAVGYANEKLPGLKAKVAEVHAQVSANVPDVPRHVNAFVGRVDGELRPWLRQTLGSAPHPALRRYAEDPVVLQGLVVAIIGAPVLLLLVPVFACLGRLFRPRPQRAPAASRSGDKKKKKAKQG